jgi:hypothetical protein
MGEAEAGFLARADKILKLLMDERVKPGANDLGELSHREIMDALGMTWEQFSPVAIYLLQAGWSVRESTPRIWTFIGLTQEPS